MLQAPDNDDPNTNRIQPDVLARLEAHLLNPEAKAGELDEKDKDLVLAWISDVKARQAVVASTAPSIGADFDSNSAHIELSPEHEITLAKLKANQGSKEAKLKTGIEWAEVEAKLRKSPEKLTILGHLVDRGGEPTVTAKLSNGNFRFDELSAESPIGNRNLDFDQAEKVVSDLGAEFMEPSVYNSFQGKIALDSASGSWLRTTKEVRKSNYALFGYHGSSTPVHSYNQDQMFGLRCSLEV